MSGLEIHLMRMRLKKKKKCVSVGNVQVVTVGLLHLQMCFNTDWQCDTHTHTKTHACAHTGAPCPPVAFPDSWSQPSSPSLHSSPLPITCVLFSSLLISSIFYPSQVFLLFFPPPPPPNLKTRGTFFFFSTPRRGFKRSRSQSYKEPRWPRVVRNQPVLTQWLFSPHQNELDKQWSGPSVVKCTE